MKIQGTSVLLFCAFIFSVAAYGQKVIEPKIGSTPDISNNAAKNLQRQKALFKKIDDLIKTYPSYEAAKEHLTPRQIEIWEHQEEYDKEDHLDVGTWGCSWYCGGGPDSIFASSVLAPFKKLDYVPRNAHDFSLRTAWVEGVKGYGIGQSITFKFPKMSPPVTTVEIYNGYMKSDKAWQDNSRVKQLKVYANQKPIALLNLRDTKAKQIFTIGAQQGKKTDLLLKFEIVSVYKGDKYDDVAIAEIEFDGTGVHCFAKGTKVAVPNGTKLIENLKVGDEILSFNAQTKQIETATILELATQKHHNLYELEFGDVKIKTTDDHPFFHEGVYFSVKENNKYGVATQAFQLGQVIDLLKDGQIKVVKLTRITPLKTCEETFTVTKLNKNSLFFANGMCVATEDFDLVATQTEK